MKLALLSIFLALPAFADEPIVVNSTTPNITNSKESIEQLKAELAQTKEQLATLGQRLQITSARCEALATFYQADAALKALDAPKQKGPGK